MKRDIKLNMGMLSETAWKIEQYLGDLDRIENASGVFLEKLKEQNSVSYETLSAEWNSGIMETEGELRERLQFLKNLLDGYIAEMESFIAPENEAAMIRVDRNDIWWNLKQIDGDLSHLEDICMSIPSSYADYRHCIMDYWTDNEAAIRAEEDAEQARRERNYRKLSDFQNRIRSVLIPNMEDKMSQLWNIYQDAIVEFENTDDAYHDKAAFYYDMWSDLGDGLTDLWRGTKDVLRGAVDAVADLGEGLLVLAMWSSPVVRVGQLFGMLPEYAEEKVAEMDAGIIQLLQDPVNTLGAIGQNMADTVDEEGLAYGISYVATDAAVEILLEKGLGKVMEGGSKLDEVTGHMDDVAAGAGKHADDVADAVTDVEKHVDDVTVIEGGSKTGTVWDNITSTADNMTATEIPATFKIYLDNSISYINPETGTNTLWTNSNATKHMGEYISRFGEESWSIGTRSQAMLESYSTSLNKAMSELANMSPGRYFNTYGSWELGINTETGVVYHARMIY